MCTGKLGLRYLWVDSLCIVQDDELEKQSEIARMQYLYQSAYITMVRRAAMMGFLRNVSATIPRSEWRYLSRWAKGLP
jgi:Heterokaryon incompatibility protein (HET)